MATGESSADRSEGDPELDLLLRAYEIERADDTHAVGLIFGLLTASLGLLSLVGFVLVQAEPADLPGWVVALAPVPPIPFAALGAVLSFLSRTRGVVIDRYEAELQRRSRGLAAGGLPVPSGHRVQVRIWDGAYGRALFGLIAIALLAMYVAVLIQSYRYAKDTEPTLAWASLVLCAAAMAVIVGLYGTSMRSGRIVQTAIESGSLAAGHPR